MSRLRFVAMAALLEGTLACGRSPEVPVVPAPVSLPREEAGNFALVALAEDFSPDPLVVDGRSGGAVAASSLDPACKGYVSTQPDHVVVTVAPIPTVRILVHSPGDTTLVLRRPDGTYLCNDDGEDRDPLLSLPLVPGRYELFVGSYRPGTQLRYRLGFTKLEGTTAGELGLPELPGPDGAAFGTVSLRPGFMPDPHVVAGRAGGHRSAARLGEGCVGWIGEAPDHLLEAEAEFELLRVLVRSRSDTSLVVRTPAGQYLCADDSEGKNPMIAGRFSPGAYRIWVGSFRQGKDTEYHLGFSLLASTRTSDVR